MRFSDDYSSFDFLANMKLFSAIWLAVSATIQGADLGDEFDLPALDEHQKNALAAFQDKKVFAEAWKHAAEDLHKRYEKIREKHSHGGSSHSHKRKIRKVVYVDADDDN